MLLMIIRVIGLVRNIAVGLCLALSPAPSWAAIGHTIKNGGGDVELEFVETWATLIRTLSPCLHPAAPCGLDESGREQLRSLVELRKQVKMVPPFDSAVLYDGAGHGKGREELLVIALELLRAQSCDNLLAPPVDFSKLAAAVFTIQYFRVFAVPAGDFVVSGVANQITITGGGRQLNLTSLIEARLGAPIVEAVNFGSDLKRGKIEVHAKINGSQVLIVVGASLEPTTTFIFFQ